jgi:hypothetical protein
LQASQIRNFSFIAVSSNESKAEMLTTSGSRPGTPRLRKPIFLGGQEGQPWRCIHLATKLMQKMFAMASGSLMPLNEHLRFALTFLRFS